MGNKISKKKTKDASTQTYTTELRSYEDACKEDSEMQSFDLRIREQTSDAITTMSRGLEVRAPSLDSLAAVTESLLAMHQDVVNVILDCKDDMWQTKEISVLVREYFDTTVTTLDFFNTLESGLRRVRSSHRTILGALQQFQEEGLVQGGNGYKKTLDELKNYKDVQSPFGEDILKMFHSVHKQQMQMLEKLKLRMNKVNKKLKRIHTWRKLSNVIFVATFATVLICSVVAAAIAAPPLITALAAASAVPLGSMGKWIKSLLMKYEKALKWNKEVIHSVEAGRHVAIEDLNNIRDLIKQLESEMTEMVKSAEYAVEHDAVKIRIDDIKKEIEVFNKKVKKLGTRAHSCSKDIRNARTAVEHRIAKNPNNASSST